MPQMPKRSEQLQRPRERKGADQQLVRKGVMRPVLIPDPDLEWHPIAGMVWNSLVESGQADFYQQSDWAYAFLTCEELSVYLSTFWKGTNPDGSRDPKRSPEMLKALLSAMDNLLITEGARRRVRVELEHPRTDQADPQLAIVHDLMQGLDGDTEDDEDE